jgi:hypothetical protein
MHRRREAGLTLVHVPVILVIVFLLAEAVSCAYLNANPPPWYTNLTPNKQDPSAVTIKAGPKSLTPGQTGTYTVQVDVDRALNAMASYTITVEIWEDDYFGDKQLDRLVKVPIPAGATSGTATFSLSCNDDGAGDRSLAGATAAQTFDDPWHVYGYVPDQFASEPENGSNYEVRCVGE